MIISLLVNGDGLSSVVGGDASHVVVDSGQDGDGFPGHVNTSEDHRSLRDSGESCSQLLWRKMMQLQVDVILTNQRLVFYLLV